MRVRVHYHLRKKVWSIIDPKTRLVIRHADTVTLADARFRVSEAGRQRCLRDKTRNVHAWVEGELLATGNRLTATAEKTARYNPFIAGHFFSDNRTENVVEFCPLVHLEKGCAALLTEATP